MEGVSFSGSEVLVFEVRVFVTPVRGRQHGSPG